jgi:charged multivesicular body protein 3
MYGPSPEEKVREWQGQLRKESRQLDREVLNVSIEERPNMMDCGGRKCPHGHKG